MMIVAAVASWFAGGRRSELSDPRSGERTGEEPDTYDLVEGAPAEDGAGRLAVALGFPREKAEDRS